MTARAIYFQGAAHAAAGSPHQRQGRETADLIGSVGEASVRKVTLTCLLSDRTHVIRLTSSTSRTPYRFHLTPRRRPSLFSQVGLHVSHPERSCRFFSFFLFVFSVMFWVPRYCTHKSLPAPWCRSLWQDALVCRSSGGPGWGGGIPCTHRAAVSAKCSGVRELSFRDRR